MHIDSFKAYYIFLYCVYAFFSFSPKMIWPPSGKINPHNRTLLTLPKGLKKNFFFDPPPPMRPHFWEDVHAMRHQNDLIDLIDVFLVSLLLTFRTDSTHCSGVSIVNFEQVNVGLVSCLQKIFRCRKHCPMHCLKYARMQGSTDPFSPV